MWYKKKRPEGVDQDFYRLMTLCDPVEHDFKAPVSVAEAVAQEKAGLGRCRNHGVNKIIGYPFQVPGCIILISSQNDGGMELLPDSGKEIQFMDNVWEKIKKGLKDGATLSMEKIEEYTKIGKLKVEELAAKRKITRNFVDIGERTSDIIEEGKGASLDGDLAIKTSMENIKVLRQELIELDRKIREIQETAKKTKPEGDIDDEITGI
jgi:hypothetical protein